MSRASVVRARASMSRMRALIGVRSSAPRVPGHGHDPAGLAGGDDAAGAGACGGHDDGTPAAA